MTTMNKILKTVGAAYTVDWEPDEELERKCQENLARWQSGDKPLAPLTDEMLDIIYRMREILHKEYFTPRTPPPEEVEAAKKINNLSNYVERMMEVEHEIIEESSHMHREHGRYLKTQADECEALLGEVDNIDTNIDKLKTTYDQVTSKTSPLHVLSEQLMKHQLVLKLKKEAINERLKYFTLYNSIEATLSKHHNYNINSEEYLKILDQINSSIVYLSQHPEYKESYSYKLRYENLLSSSLQNVVSVVHGIITDATNQVINLDLKSNLLVIDSKAAEPNVETAFSFYYGKFQNAAKKVSRVINYVEDNVEKDVYSRTLGDFQKSYFSQRSPVMQAAVSKALLDLRDKYKVDHGILFRSAGLFIIKVCQDETTCYNYFFKQQSQQLRDYLSSLCQNLYDTLRPCLISINHIEVLTELCTILKEMVNDQAQNNPALDQFVETVSQLLQDVEERLVFRTNMFFQYDLSAYEPSPGDLAYPEKLEQMENIAEELIERRTDSRASSVSMESQEVANINASSVGQFRSYTGNSPADLHGMWYPTVKRTLVCLSRLYICLDREIFQGVAQEGLIICVRTIEKAAAKIAAKKSHLDGRLFQIKHLLIVREQIAPFHVDFTVKEMSLDFSNMRPAAMDLLNNRDKIFSISNNALLEFLLEGTPRVKEYLVDSRKEIDKQLKLACETFIANTTKLLIENLLQWLQKAEHFQKLSDTYKENAVPLRDQEFSKPQLLAGIISAAQRNIKTKIPDIQRSMRLYLANRETEFILFRPIKNNIVNAFMQFDQMLVAAKYTAEDQLLIACPTPEQLSVLISSVSLTAEQDLAVFSRSTSRYSDKGKS